MPVFDTTSKLVVHFRKIQELSYTIQLQLNPAGEIDRHIILILASGGINNPSDMKRMTRTARTLVLHSQWLLKAEWEKVKFEGGSPGIGGSIERTRQSERQRIWNGLKAREASCR
jgi:hypothetical protein